MTKQEQIQTLPKGYIDLFNKNIRPNTFIPKSVKDIENLDVIFDEITDKTHKELYYSAVVLTSSWTVNKLNPGRWMGWFVRNRKDRKYLGMIVLSSELCRNKIRDDVIKWNDQNKFGQRRLQSIAQVKTCIPFRSFGRECLGGKLLIKLSQTKYIVDRYQQKYGQDKLVLLTTTSLNPCPCQYNGVPHWKHIGSTDTGRPTFFCPLYSNYQEFLCGKINENQLSPNDHQIIEIRDVLSWWKPKSIKRMTNRIETNTFNPQPETYFDELLLK